MNAPDLKMAEELLRIAHAEMRSLAGMANSQDFPDAIFGFHAQQVAEKALKAWIAVHGQVFPLTHNLERLVELLELAGADVTAHEGITELTSYAVALRYVSSSRATAEMDRTAVRACLSRLIDDVEQAYDACAPDSST